MEVSGKVQTVCIPIVLCTRDLDEKKVYNINNRRRNARPADILLLLLYFYLVPSEILSENSTANFLRIGSDKYFRA